MNIIVGIILIVAALIIGGLCGFMIFRFVIKGKYNDMIGAAKKEAEKQQAEDEARNSEKELLDMGDESEEDIESGEGEEGSGLQQIDMGDELDDYMEDDVR